MKEDPSWYLPWILRPEQLNQLEMRGIKRRSSYLGHDAVRRPRPPTTLKPPPPHRVAHLRAHSYDDSSLAVQELPQPTKYFPVVDKKDLNSPSTEEALPKSCPSLDKCHAGICRQVAGHSLTSSLPAINFHSDAELDEIERCSEDAGFLKSCKRPEQRKATKLKRRKACYRHKKDGRSKSLTHIDTLDPGMLVAKEEGDCRSEPDTSLLATGSQDRLAVPNMSTTTCNTVPTTPSVPVHSVANEAALRRRRLSNLYKITSSEYFSVSFDCLEDPGQEEFVAASKGTSLREALATVCERRGVDLSNVNVYLDSSKTPLSLITTETFWLGGKHLRIKGKEGIKSPVRTVAVKSVLQQQSTRKSSGSYRSGKNSRALSGAASTEDPASVGVDYSAIPVTGSLPIGIGLASHDGSLKGSKGSKSTTRWSGLFSTSYKDTKMDSLAEQLNEYSRHGIPRLPHLLTFEADEDTEEALYSLEEDWKNIVRDWTLLPERQRQQQNAIWELVQTEVAYIRRLKVITDLFMACLCNLQVAQILNDVDTERLFSNIPEIYIANRQFWAEYVVPMLKAARAAQSPLDPTILREAFIKFDEIFHPYTKYCLDQTQCQQYCREKDNDNELFKAYLAWCETQRDCSRLRLMDILVKPMQRLTKYSLLLKAIHKKTDDESHKAALVEMIQGVESFVGHVNSALRQRHEQERLREILSRIESYDAVEAKDEEIERLVRSHCDLDLTKPMPSCSEHQRRHLLTEGDLKLRDQASSKMDVHCFLFTDVLLICKPVARKAERVKVIRPPILVDRLVVIELTRDPAGLGLVYLNELGTASAAFSLHAPEPKQSKTWLEHIRKAQELYREAKAAAAAAVHADTLFYTCEEDDDLDFPNSALLVARSPRGSSRGSRGSSLVHSHSGSMDMNDPLNMAGHTRVSLDSAEVKRASSASSEDSGGQLPSAAATTTNPSTNIKQKPSPRPERRLLMGRTYHHSISPIPTPNTLSVQVPHIIASNQDSADVATPDIVTESLEVDEKDAELEDDVANPETDEMHPHLLNAALAKRMNRNERSDNRRYHTAGAIEDIKKQDSKNTSIHKRLSWNYGQQSPSGTPSCSLSASRIFRSSLMGSAANSDSMLSFSSSGVSSTGSLHLSTASEAEDVSELEATNKIHISSTYITNSDPPRTEASNVEVRLYQDKSPHVFQLNDTSTRPVPPPPPPRSLPVPASLPLGGDLRIDVSEVCDGISSVQITVSGADCSSSNSSSSSANGKPSRADLLRMKDLILSDASMEASEV